MSTAVRLRYTKRMIDLHAKTPEPSPDIKALFERTAGNERERNSQKKASLVALPKKRAS